MEFKMKLRSGSVIPAAALCLSVLATGVALAQPSTTPPATGGSMAENTQTNQRDASMHTTTPVDQPNNSADIRLAASVRKAVVGDHSLSTKAHNVKLVAASGVVTLRGPVISATEKAKVGQVVQSVAGVSEVNNQLDVVQPNQ
jgi:hyperosmotically inducible periplasmic protein